MKSLLTITALTLVLFSCSENATQETLELTNYKQRISYAMGADHAGQLVNSGDPNFAKYDKEQIIKGFEIGLKDEKAFDEKCQKCLENLVGTSRQEFNPAYKTDGSLCIGKIMGTVFTSGWKKNKELSKFDLELVKAGFSQAINGCDTLIETGERAQMIQDFMGQVSKKMMADVQRQEKPFFEKIKAQKGITALPEGMYLETIKAGKGGKPATGDDVLVDYILTNIKNDTIESSIAMKKMGQPMPAFSLNGVIRGWSVGVPFMQKGGAYRLYVPTALAYGKEPLVFYIELKDFGKPGSLVKAPGM